MKTLKQFLTENGINLTDEQRYKLGARIGQSWSSLNYNNGKERQYIDENSYNVRLYENEFLNDKKVRRCILKFLKML